MERKEHVLNDFVEPEWDELAERAVLGGMIADPSLIAKALNMGLEEDDFYLEKHRQVYALLLKLFSEYGEQWDDIMAVNYAQKHGLDIDLALIHALVEEGATGLLFDSAVHIVKEKAGLRKLKDIGLKIFKLKNLEDADSIMFSIEEVLKPRYRSKSYSAAEVISEVYEITKALRKQEKLITGKESGFLDLDLLTMGFQPGHFVVVGARPGMGKSSFMLSLLLNMVKRGTKVGVISLEMTRQELTQRLLAMETGIMLKKIRTGQLSDEEWQVFHEKSLELRRLPFWINDTPGFKLSDIRLELRIQETEVLFIDYLQLVKVLEKRNLSRQEEVFYISQSLKTIAKDFKICIIALAQLNRQVEHRADKRPTLSDLRESGAIEQDADIVLFLHRPEYYKKDPDKQGLTEIIIAKNRHGPTGTVLAYFDHETTAFSPLRKTQLAKEETIDEEELSDIGSELDLDF